MCTISSSSLKHEPKENYRHEGELRRGSMHRNHETVGVQQRALIRSRRRIAAGLAVALVASVGVMSATVPAPVSASAGQPSAEMAVTVAGVPIRDSSVVDDQTSVNVGVTGLLTPGTTRRELRASLDPGMKYTAGGAQAPEGWSIEYSTDDTATWSSTEPVPASDVTDVRAVADVTAGAISGYSQLYSSSTVAPIPSSTFSASTGGDGWDVFFSDDYVFNIFHHSDAIILDCHLRSTGDRCADYVAVFPGYYASMRSGGWVDTITGKLYAFTAEQSSGIAGVLCIDITSAPQSCGFTPLTTDTSVGGWDGLTEAESVGRRLFGVETAGDTGSLLCYDPALGSACPGSPLELENVWDYAITRLTKVGSKMMVKTATELYCFEASNMAPCSGTWPHAIDGWNHTPIAPHTDAQGTPNGVCDQDECIDLSGGSTNWVTPFSLGYGDWAMHAAAGALTQGRYYFLGDDPNAVECFDYATESSCENFPLHFDDTGLLYTIRTDPNNPSCMWINSDAGKIHVFDAFSAAPECTAAPVITLQPSSFAPRFTCSSNDSIDEWKTLRLASFAGTGTPTSVTLTVRNALGDAVSGWTDKPVTVGSPLDMTGLDVTQSGSRPTFSFAFGGVTGGTITAATIDLDYSGKGPELCVHATLDSGHALCPVLTGLDGTLIDGAVDPTTFAVRRTFTIGTDPSTCPENIVQQTVPSAPRDLTGAGSNGSALLRFRAPVDDGGAALREYKYSLDAGGTWSTAVVLDNGDGSLGIALLGLTPGTTYPVELKATNVIGRSASATLSLFVAARATQTISVDVQDTALDAGPLLLPATTSGAMALTYSAGPSQVCTASGAAIVLHALGTCTVTADQAGDENHRPATAQASFEVTATAAIGVSIEVEPGGPIGAAIVHVHGEGLQSETSVRVELHSEPVLLGTVTTDANGSFATDVRLPAIVPPGTHHIVAISTAPDGGTVTTTRELFVDWAGAFSEPETKGGYTPLVARRILDTRETGDPLVAATARRLVLADGLVPSDVSAVEINLTVARAVHGGYVTVYPCGATRPLAAAINFVAGETKANLVDGMYRTGGALCLWSNVDVDIVIDLQGYHSDSSVARLVPRRAVRLLDTRLGDPVAAGEVRQIPVIAAGAAPAGTAAVALNVAVDRPDHAGFLTVFPCGTDRPWASNVNFAAGQTVSNEVLVAPGGDGTVCIYSTSGTDLVVDLDATYDASGVQRFTALVAGRLADTRLAAKVSAGQPVEWTVLGGGGAPAGTTALALNVAVTDPAGAGYLTVYPCGGPVPWASNLNFAASQTTSNHVTVAVGDAGKICVFASQDAHVVIDVEGTYAAS
jgi:hypothetical protein